MRICMTFYEEAEKKLTGDHERVIGIASSLRRLGHDVYLVESAFDDRCFQYKGIEIVHVNRAYTKKLETTLGKLTLIIDEMTQIKGVLSKLSQFLLDEPFAMLKERRILAASDLVVVVGDTTFAPIIYAKILRKKVILDCLSFYLQSLYREKCYVSFLSYYSRLVFYTILGKLDYHFADKILVPSYEELKLSAKTFKVPESKVFMIPNGLDTQIFKPDQKAREKMRCMLGMNANDLVVLFLGGNSSLQNELAVKYISDTLAPTVLAKHNGVFFVITGPWKKNGYHRNVIFPGYVNDVNELVNAADICIAPLVTGTGTKIKMLAYMACGKATIATPVASEGLNLSDGKQVLLCEIDDFANVVLNAIGKSAHLTDLGKNARTHVEQTYSWIKITNDINAILSNIVK